MKMVFPSATAAATAALIQSTQNLSIGSIESSSSTSSSTSLSSYSLESLPRKKFEGPRKKVPFRPSKRQQMRVTTGTTPQKPSSCSDAKERHPSVCIPSDQDYMFTPNAWSKISSTVWNSDRTKEVILEWDEAVGQEEQLVEISRVAVDKTKGWFEKGTTDTSRMFRLLNLSSSVRCFVKHCRSNLTNIRSYKLKITVMHGSKATRCPLWHADNVPLRWIQTYAGQGCVYLHEEAHNDGVGSRPIQNEHNKDTAVGNFDPLLQRVRESDNDKEEQKHGPNWKNKLVELSGVSFSQSPTGEPAILVGRMWSPWSIEQQQDSSLQGPMAGVLHRSPHNIPRNQGRILLNLDVVCSYDSEEDSEEEGHHHDHDHEDCGGSCKESISKRTVSIIPSQDDNINKESWFQRRNKTKNVEKAKADRTDCACSPQDKCPCTPKPVFPF